MTALRFFVEFMSSNSSFDRVPINSQQTTVPRIKDKPPEFPDDAGHPSISDPQNLPEGKRLIEIEERQDKVTEFRCFYTLLFRYKRPERDDWQI